MESERSLQHSQEPSTCPYPEPHRFSPCRDIQLPDILILSCHPRLLYRITTDQFTSVLLHHNFIKAMRHSSMFQPLKSHLQECSWYILAASSTKWVTICKVHLRVYRVVYTAEWYCCGTQYMLHTTLNFTYHGDSLYCGTRWCTWLRHCATNREVTVSIPDGVIGICHWRNPSGRTMALE
jgi:hypothetical protein